MRLPFTPPPFTPPPFQPETYSVIELEWSTGQDFLDDSMIEDKLLSFTFTYPDGRLIPPSVTIGKTLSVLIRFLDRNVEFHVHGRVIEKQPNKSPPKIRIEFIHEEQERQQLVLSAARGESIFYRRRRAPRIDCPLDVQIALGKSKHINCIGNQISRFGMHLSLEDFPAVDEKVRLLILFPRRSRPIELWARVASTIKAGPQRGIGVEFVFGSTEQRDELAENVAILEARGRT